MQSILLLVFQMPPSLLHRGRFFNFFCPGGLKTIKIVSKKMKVVIVEGGTVCVCVCVCVSMCVFKNVVSESWCLFIDNLIFIP